MNSPSLDPALEAAPIPAYVFQLVGDDFILRGVNAQVRAAHPDIVGLYGRSLLALYRDLPEALEAARACVQRQAPITLETTVRRYDRAGANQHLALTFIFAPPDGLVLYSRDLTPPSLDKAAVLEAEGRQRSLLEALTDAVIIRGPDGVILACNAVAARLMGHAGPADLIGLENELAPGFHIVKPDGTPLPVEQRLSRQVRATGQAVVGRVFGLVNPAGATTWLRVSMQPVLEGATNKGLVATFTDITDRVEAERQLTESATQLALALEAARMGTWRWNIDEGWVTWSEGAWRLFHTRIERADATTFLASIHPDDRARASEALVRVRDAYEPGGSFEAEYRIVGQDGVIRWARVHGRVGTGPGPRVALGTAMDVTARRHLEEELRRSNRLESLGRLAGGIAHDFNNLLAAMMASLELIDVVVPSPAREDVLTIRHAAERAKELTRQLLAFARQQPFAAEVVALGPIVSRAERLLRRLVGAEVTLEVTAGHPGHVRADASQLEQVLVNLVVNAREAMPRGGQLTVRVDGASLGPGRDVPPGEYLLLEVTDTGVGMDDETRRHAFDPFFTTKPQGTGLGLASCYGIVKQHGGTIVVDTEAGRGTSFRVYLPLVDPPPAAAPSAPRPPRPSVGRVLLVEDDPVVRRTTARVVQGLGYEVLVADGPDAALALSLAEPRGIDLLLSDVSMPGRSGPSLARELCVRRPEMKVVFVSGYPEDAVVEPGLAFRFLQKPWTRDELATLLAGLLGPR